MVPSRSSSPRLIPSQSSRTLSVSLGNGASEAESHKLPGLARLELCSSWLTREAAKNIAGFLPVQGIAPSEQQELQEALSCLAWMDDHGVRFRDQSPFAAGVAELYRLLVDGESPMLLCDEILKATRAHVRLVLTEAGEAANGPPVDVHANVWSLAFAKLLVSPYGCDASLLPILGALLVSDNLDWLPSNGRDDYLWLLKPLVNDVGLLDRVDQISRIDPVHARAQCLLRSRDLLLSGVGGPQCALAIHLLQTLLTPPLQYAAAGGCWKVACDRDLLLSQPDRLLAHLETYLRHGVLEFRNACGDVDPVVPDLYPAQTMAWATRPCPSTNDLAWAVGRIAHALSKVFPHSRRSQVEWEDALRAEALKILRSAPDRGVVPRDVLERVIAQHIVTSARFLADAGRPVDSMATLSQLVRQCLTTVEISEYIPPLALVWQSVHSSHLINKMVEQKCWAPIEDGLRRVLTKWWPFPPRPAHTPIEGLRQRFMSLPEDTEAHIARMRQLFMQCATLRRDLSPELEADHFRLFMKVSADAEGHGVPIGRHEELVGWLVHLSRRVAEEESFEHREDALVRHALIEKALRGPDLLDTAGAFLANVDRQKHKPEHGVWLHGNGDHGRGGLEAVPCQDGEVGGAHHQVWGERHPVWAGFAQQFVGFFPTTIHVGPHDFRLSSRSARNPRLHTNAKYSLYSLIDFLRALDKGKLPFSLREHLKTHPGLVVSSSRSVKDSHRFLLRPQELETAWKTHVHSPRRWVRDNLIGLMNAGLEQKLPALEAQAWLAKVLRRCELKPDADVDVAVAVVMKWAGKDAGTGATYKLKTLVAALDRLANSKARSPFAVSDARHNRIWISVLNEFPGGAPVVPYAHSNWVPPMSDLAYWVNPSTGAVEHGVGVKRVHAHDAWTFEFTQCDPHYHF